MADADPRLMTMSNRNNIRDWTRLRVQPRKLPDDLVELLDHADAKDDEVARLKTTIDTLTTELERAFHVISELRHLRSYSLDEVVICGRLWTGWRENPS